MPSSPGVYIFEDEKKEPLYIGKSINLRSRIKQHYEGFTTDTSKAAKFIPQTVTLYLKPVKNDLEAIITEANYIKTSRPRYNSAIKDDKSNAYIIFTNPPDTKLIIIHSTDIQTLELEDFQKQVWGPYTSTGIAQVLLKQIRRIFGFCNSPFNSRNRACFNYHIDLCPGACMWLITPTQYQRHLGRIKKFLSGQFVLLNRSLHKEIARQIKKQDYESAEITKRQIEGLEQVLMNRNSSLLLKLSDATEKLRYKIVTSLHHPKLKKSPRRLECYDLAHLQGENYVGSMAVFIDSQPSVQDYRHFNIRLPDRSDPHAMKQILARRFNHPEWGTPDLIVLDGGIPQLSIVLPVIPDDIPVIALAKKRETIYFFDQDHKTASISLDLDDPVLNLFKNLRDEAHRFANTFHRQQRTRDLTGKK